MTNYFFSGSAPQVYPTDTFFSLLVFNDGRVVEMPKKYPYQGEWGKPLSTYLHDVIFPIPASLDMVYLSIIERKFYSVEKVFSNEKLVELFSMDLLGRPLFEYIVVGMAPYGEVAVWIYGEHKSVIVDWIKGEYAKVDMADFLPMTPNVTLDENCDFYINNDPQVKANLEINGLPPCDLFDRYMQQFTYRYIVQFGHWDEEKKEWNDYDEDESKPEFDYIEEALYDGTHDKLHNGGLMQYHSAGKPKKLALQFHIKKSDYSAYFWLEDFKIRAAFESFYHEYPEAGMDFLFRIDPEKDIYQILFTCKEAEPPLLLNEESYQMIVFKSKFERYRTKNYNQPRGAWIW